VCAYFNPSVAGFGIFLFRGDGRQPCLSRIQSRNHVLGLELTMTTNSTIDEVSARALRELSSPPTAGAGVHQWLFATACLLTEAGYSRVAKFEMLHQASRRVGRAVPAREINSAIAAAEQKTGRVSEQGPVSKVRSIPTEAAWPAPDTSRVYLLGKNGPGLYDLWEHSPLRFDDEGDHCEETIDVLFPGNPLLCVGKSAAEFATRRRDVWRGHLADCQLIVPNPMLAISGLTQEGKKSEHAKTSVGRRCYLVTEFDIAPYARDGRTRTAWAPIIESWAQLNISVADACAAAILELAGLLPLVLVVFSGGKSLHAWWRVFGKTETQSRDFMRTAVRNGADPKTFDRNQFVRMPGGLRTNGNRQTIYYFAPEEALPPSP
jgi:hypothetical protein